MSRLMLPTDCTPDNLNERVIEIISPTDNDGNTTFFVYRLTHVHFGVYFEQAKVVGQIFKTSLPSYLKRLEESGPQVEYRTVKHVGASQ